MKIIQLTAENVKKLKVIDITPTKDFIQITGKNGSGKTSVLDAIWWALAGKDAIQGQPIRKGQEKAIIKLNLGSMTVTRRFTESGTTLTVENAEGFKAPSPQAMLDAIIGHLTFDPLEFSRMEAKKQFDALKVIADVKIDLEAFAAQDKISKEQRAAIKRDVKNLEGRLTGIAVSDDAPDEPVDVAALMKNLNDIEDQNSLVREVEISQDNDKLMHKQELARIEGIRVALADAEEKANKLLRKIHIHESIKYQSTDEVKAQISGAQSINTAYLAKKQRGEINAEIALKGKDIEVLDKAIDVRNDERMRALQESKMPIDGLAFGEGSILYNEIPFDQLSAAEQLRVSVAIAMAANPKLKVIRIKDGSLLDDDSLKIIQTMATDREYQVWCERVETSGKVGIVMEEGEVVADNQGESNA